MKVGMIFECGPGGADKTVCIHLAKRIDPGIQTEARTLDDKPNLIANCGSAAAELFKDGCDRVVIVWDSRPAWPDMESKPCLKKERRAIYDSLRGANVQSERVYLVCIMQELEAWLLADERAIGAVLSSPAHPVAIHRRRKVDQIPNPKSVLNNIFKEHKGRRYVDRIHAEQIVKAMPDLNRLRRVKTFHRFALKVADVEL